MSLFLGEVCKCGHQITPLALIANFSTLPLASSVGVNWYLRMVVGS